ncbi:autotransporter domain-containing protein [Campylobacter devanensis]|uniref:autotransporter domain-containing protein n=1 Tax=Campylobacter devanensis TaxID=3161138 RepID=UPI000A349B53|nr:MULTISPECIES: autotransporter domain-containing protein [unclassified Campylobacter]
MVKFIKRAFKESGEIFAKNYDNINHDLYTVGLGLNLAYEGSDEKSRYTGYIIYERMLDGYNMDASAEFNDFKGQKFSQRYHLDKNRLNLGVGAKYALIVVILLNLALVASLLQLVIIIISQLHLVKDFN